MSRPRQNLDWLEEELSELSDLESPSMTKFVKWHGQANDQLLNKSFRVCTDVSCQQENTSCDNVDDPHNTSLRMLSEIHSLLTSQTNVGSECVIGDRASKEMVFTHVKEDESCDCND